MESSNPPEKTLPVQYARSKAFRQFKNPPQPHMCIRDNIKDGSEMLFINVLGWNKISNPKLPSDPIPLYGGMQVPQSSPPNSKRPPMLVFAVMVNPDILKTNGKNSKNVKDRQALVSLMCDFVEAMNPGLYIARNSVIMRDRDLFGELKDVWLAVQNKREREKGVSHNVDIYYKVYDIDGIGGEEQEDDKTYAKNKQNEGGFTDMSNDKKTVKSSKQILMNAGQKSEFDSGMNNSQLNQSVNRENTQADTTYCTPVYGQIVSSRENHNQINEIQQKFASNETKPSSSFCKDWNPPPGKTTEGWDEFSKRNMSAIKNEEMKKPRCFKTEKTKQQMNNGKNHYDFFPYFDNKSADSPDSELPPASVIDEKDSKNEDDSNIIIEPMQNLVLHSTDNKICDNKASALSSIES